MSPWTGLKSLLSGLFTLIRVQDPILAQTGGALGLASPGIRADLCLLDIQPESVGLVGSFHEAFLVS